MTKYLAESNSIVYVGKESIQQNNFKICSSFL